MTQVLTRGALADQSEILLRAGSQWRLSPYVRAALEASGEPEQAFQVPVYQSAVAELLARKQIPRVLSIRDLSAPPGVGAVAVLDALLAQLSAGALYTDTPQFEDIHIRLEVVSPALQAFRQAVEARAHVLSNPRFFRPIQAAEWNSKPSTASSPNLVLVALPQIDLRLDSALLDQLPDGCLLIVVEWQQTDRQPTLFAWRRNWLLRHTDWSAFGPCGQEYGRELPKACDGCVHGHRASLRRHGSLVQEDIPIWSYTILIKSREPVEPLPADAISEAALQSAFVDHASLRYVGTFRKARPTTDEPDSAHDDPADRDWHEYLKVCPGHSGPPALALERRAGMQVPPLRYGQWLALEQLQIQPLNHTLPNVPVIRVRNEAAFKLNSRGSIAEAFLLQYDVATRAAVDEAGYRLFGFDQMREFQHSTFARTLCGYSVFAIAATGGGKSECYILPAMLLPGITVVISPLKSLILDQFEQRIRFRYGLDARTTFINSDVSFYERQGRLRRMVLGHFKLVYLTPEQLERGYVLDALRQADEQVGVRFIAFDEAHCISQWGHDFRPSYLNIVRRLEDYGLRPVRIALTATASPLVREDVCAELHLDRRAIRAGGDVLVESSNRPELNLVVRRVRTSEEKAAIITAELLKLGDNGSAIVFMPHTGGTPDNPRQMGTPINYPQPENAGMTSPGVTPFAHYLEKYLRQPIAVYHGALNDETQDADGEAGTTRQAEQRAFMSGAKRIMVATKGFGMGVDKPDIRLVIHRSPPANLEAYAQEAGRAGRDQKLATVMLLLSPDSPRIFNIAGRLPASQTTISSDIEIQQYFIDNRYVQHADLLAVYAFLRSGRADTINSRLYFTSDQVAQFLDECGRRPALGGLEQAYQWPDFPIRKASGNYESPDHGVVLKAGYIYAQRRDYIKRILAVMFSTQPIIGGVPISAFRSVQEVGTQLIRCNVYQPQQMLDATAYFGERFRATGLTVAELDQLLPSGDRVDLVPLAQRLGVSLAETASILRDIRQARGRTSQKNKWVGTLLNFWWMEAPRRVPLPDPYDPSEWRQYAGAYRRDKPREGKTLDDYFPPFVLSKPYGWEVTPDAGLEAADPRPYLAELLSLHDSRRRNDENNFNYLLTEYIGSDGKPSKCLRSILLGYLKTGEVVTGGKCFSCSVCVPDLAFADFPIEKRRTVITHLFAETAQLFDQLELKNRERPALEMLARVLQAVDAEEQAGRSGRTYLASWLARVVQDDPDHLSAHWTRLHAFRNSQLSLSPTELLGDLHSIVRGATEREDLLELRTAVEYCLSDSQFSTVTTQLTVHLVQLCGRLEDWQSESKGWQGLVTRLYDAGADSERPDWLRQGLARLVVLHRPGGPLSQDPQAGPTIQEAALRLARWPGSSYESTYDNYSLVVEGWKWAQTKEELSLGQAQAHAGLVAAWLKTNPESSEIQAAAADLALLTGEWDTWPPTALWIVEAHLGPDLARLPGLLLETAELLALIYNDTGLAARFIVRAWAAKNELAPHLIAYLGVHIGEIEATWCLAVISADDQRAADLLDQMTGSGNSLDLNALFDRFPPASLQLLPSERLVTLVAQGLAANRPLSGAILNAAKSRLQRPDGELFASALQGAVEQQPQRAVSLLEALSTAQVVSVALVAGLFPSMFVSPTMRDRLPKLLESVMPQVDQFADGSLIRVCIEAWTMLRVERQTLKALCLPRIEGKELVRFVERWSRGSKQTDLLDLLVIILEDIRSRSSTTWLTPLSLWFQVLCAAGRFEEADSVLERGAVVQIRIDGQSAREYLFSMRKRIQQRLPKFVSELRWLWALAK